MTNYSTIPTELKAKKRWVGFVSNKTPINPKTNKGAKANDPTTWSTFDNALFFCQQNTHIAGIGYQLGEGIVGIDLDNCRNTESNEIDRWAMEIIEKLDSYTEISPSGSGVHILIKGEKHGKGCKKDYQNGKVEIYDSRHYFTMTGNHLDGTPKILNERTEQLSEVYARVFGSDEKKEMSTVSYSPSTPSSLSDRQLIEKALKAKNGDCFDRLWHGDWKGHHSSQSEADLAFCNMLTYWSQGDRSQTDTLFQQSGLMREKWHEVHSSDGRTYGQMTIDRAMAGVTSYYNPNYKSKDPIAGSISPPQKPTKVKNRKETKAKSKKKQKNEKPPIKFPHDVAWRGIFGIYREALKGTSEACDAYHFGVFATVAGIILGRSAYVCCGGNIYPNFYTCLIGRTGRTRKSTAMNRGRDLLKKADGNVIALSHLATPEGLILALAKVDPDVEVKKGVFLYTPEEQDEINARNEATSELEGYRLLNTNDEFASILRKAKKNGSDGLIQCLTNAFDCPSDLHNPTRVDPIKAPYPTMAMIGCSTKEWLENSLNADDIHGGFVNRFCFYISEPSEPIPNPPQPNIDLWNTIADELSARREDLEGRHVKFSFDTEAVKLLEKWYKDRYYRKYSNILIEQTVQRIDTNTRKLALLYAILENDNGDYLIKLDQLETAIEVGNYWEKVMIELFGTFAIDQRSKLEQKIIERLMKTPRSKRKLQQSLGGIMSAEDLNRSLKALIETNAVILEDNVYYIPQ